MQQAASPGPVNARSEYKRVLEYICSVGQAAASWSTSPDGRSKLHALTPAMAQVEGKGAEREAAGAGAEGEGEGGEEGRGERGSPQTAKLDAARAQKTHAVWAGRPTDLAVGICVA